MSKITLKDVIAYCKRNNLSKKDELFLLKLYRECKENNLNSKEITWIDISESLKKLNESLEQANDTKVVNRKINEELRILDKINSNYFPYEKIDKKKIMEIFYDACMLLYEEDLKINKADLILDDLIIKKDDKKAKL